MLSTLQSWIDADFMPHGYCYLWLPEIVWLHVGADGLIALAYFMIPTTLVFFVAKRRDEVPFPWMFVMFGAFITACGITHLFNIWTIWNSNYGVEGLVKLATAMISLATAFALIPILPTALALRSPAQLERVNRLLESEIEVRKRAEARLQHLAHHDLLTGLPNRILLGDRLNHALNAARRDGTHVAVMLLDLDDFKQINDAFGHAAGDRLLEAAAARLRTVPRSADTLARFGGDEFVVVLAGVGTRNEAEALAKRLIDVLCSAFQIAGREVLTGASIGIALFPQDGTTAQDLLRNADLAQYRAKTAGGQSYRFYDPEAGRVAQLEGHLEAALRCGVVKGEFGLVYQPQVEITSGRVVGVEALLRWHRPDAGPVPPRSFIALAERSGLIHPIGQWVLEEACRQARRWQASGACVRVAVNVSGAQFQDRKVAQLVGTIVANLGLEPGALELELTENVLMDDPEIGLALEQIARLGVGLAIDDFGTGFSSLAYLTQFPSQRIKIDQSFVQRIGQDGVSESIIRAVIGLAHSLDKRVVAEGVETAEQLSFLRAQGCDEAQGYLLGYPRPAEHWSAGWQSLRHEFQT
jgi:diguanylate cyclase (GGDEF)-like protein